MRLKGLDLNLLIVLDALLAERNVSATAERLNLSQSAVSGMLARLRDAFDDDLLRPVGRRMVLTERAEELVRPVRETLELIEQKVIGPTTFDPGAIDTGFSISASDHITTSLILPRLRAVSDLAPNLSVTIFAPGDTIVDPTGPATLIDRGDIDFLVALAGTEHPDHPAVDLHLEDLVVIVDSANARLSDQPTLEDILRLDQIGLHFGRFSHRPFDRHLDGFMSKRRVTRWMPSPALVPPAVVGTRCAAIVARSLAEFAARLYPLRIVELPEPMPLRHLLQWHRARENDPAAMWLARKLLDGSETP